MKSEPSEHLPDDRENEDRGWWRRKSLRLRILLIAIPIIFVWTCWIGNKAIRKKIYIWLPSYVAWEFDKAGAEASPEAPTDIMFLSVDHFEPGFHTWKVSEWAQEYPRIADKHHDADGIVPQYTWFYPAEQFKLDQMEILADMAARGYGEIELHLHHDHDTSESLRRILDKAKEDFSLVGALETVEGKPAFGFIHGNWALDDSIAHTAVRNPCGVRNELILLREEGCYADFTFPSWGFESQPSQLNSIFYAIDDPDEPKSYDTGPPVTVGKPAVGDLMIFEGPLSINFQKWRHHDFPYFYPLVEVGEIVKRNPPLPFRVDEWVRIGIHVEGRPSWIFVKTYAHGATDEARPVLLGKEWDDMHTYLEKKYNDGKRYRLHYVTAREAYNIVKAAEAGKTGDPNQYRDFVIPPYKTSLRKPGT